mmetsp:Transcript_12499/g.44194  ORF Transcript_12499/g.44194 Transcript_12499/m.44194 type:complete len:261 (+) Transcript_12499:549-1331(+)
MPVRARLGPTMQEAVCAWRAPCWVLHLWRFRDAVPDTVHSRTKSCPGSSASSGTFWLHTLPEVFLKATGRRPSDVWDKEFAKPLGLSDKFSWPSVDFYWAAGSEGTCRDYAKLGQLMLNKGQWRGMEHPIVDAKFIAEMTTPQKFAPYHDYANPCYGLLTWLNTNPGSDRGSPRFPGVCQMWPAQTWLPAGTPSDLYLVSGVLGQDILVVPSMDLLMVTMGSSADDYSVQRILGESLCMMFPGSCETDESKVDSDRPLSI